jgi:hypothetical protein
MLNRATPLRFGTPACSPGEAEQVARLDRDPHLGAIVDRSGGSRHQCDRGAGPAAGPDLDQVPVGAVVGERAGPVVGVEGQAAFRGDRVDGCPPVGLGVHVGAPGVAVHAEPRRVRSVPVHRDAGVQLIPVRPLQVHPDMGEGGQEQPLHVGVPPVLALQPGHPGRMVVGVEPELGAQRVQSAEDVPDQGVGQRAQFPHGRHRGEDQQFAGVHRGPPVVVGQRSGHGPHGLPPELRPRRRGPSA